jgi:hypothetical protein
MKTITQFTKLALGLALATGVATQAFADNALYSTSAEPERTNMDVGISVGTPGGLNLGVTKWGIGSVPVLLRASGSYLGSNIWGYQPEIGIAFDTEGLFRQYFSVAYTRTSLNLPARGEGVDWEGFGPVYGINWGGFSAQVGLSFGSGTAVDAFVARRITTPQLLAQVGYAFYF